MKRVHAPIIVIGMKQLEIGAGVIRIVFEAVDQVNRPGQVVARDDIACLHGVAEGCSPHREGICLSGDKGKTSPPPATVIPCEREIGRGAGGHVQVSNGFAAAGSHADIAAKAATEVDIRTSIRTQSAGNDADRGDCSKRIGQIQASPGFKVGCL